MKAAGVRDAERKRTRCATCSVQPRKKLLPRPEHRSRAKAPKKRQPRACETRRGNEHGARLAHRSRAKSFCPARNTEAGRRPRKNESRGRARRGEKTNTVRDLPTAAARKAFALPGTQKPGEGSENTTAAGVRDTERKRTRCASCPPQPREKLLPCLEHRSRAKAPKTRQPRACETRRGNEHGARLARRSRASCPPQVWYFCASADGSEELGRSGDWVDQQKEKERRASFRPVRTWRRGAPPPTGTPAGNGTRAGKIRLPLRLRTARRAAV